MSIEVKTPEELLTYKSEELLSQLAGVDEWTPDLAELVDYVCRHKVVTALTRPAEAEGREQLIGFFKKVARRARRKEANAPGKSWASVWAAYARLLETEAEMEAFADSGHPFEHLHVADAYKLIESKPGIAQSELRTRLNLGKSNCTRILRILEDQGRIESRQVGKAKYWSWMKMRKTPAQIPPICSTRTRTPSSRRSCCQGSC